LDDGVDLSFESLKVDIDGSNLLADGIEIGSPSL